MTASGSEPGSEPIPVDGPAAGSSVEVFCAGWEIECCQEPPGVGDVVQWALRWRGGAGEPGSGSLPWRQTPWQPSEEGFSAGVILRLGGITAWSDAEDEVPDPGWLSVEGHGGAPEDLPRTRGVVRRVQVVEQEFDQVGADQWVQVPGAFGLREVSRSPTWFDWGSLVTTSARGTQESGLLIHLDVSSD